jgi:hypothetical protein
MTIQEQLEEMGLSPVTYLRRIRASAREAGYDARDISLATDGVHKIVAIAPNGTAYYAGAVGYGDFHIWSMLEARGDVPRGTAETKRRLYRARATKIRGKWYENPFSANSLALSLLW